MKILIYGAGAIGSNLGGLLTQGGQDGHFIGARSAVRSTERSGASD